MSAPQPPYVSRRSCVVASPGTGMIACTQPHAAAMGQSILLQGGNAMDAAIAVAAGMALTEPCSTGLGGDAFVLYYDAQLRTVRALNGSGRSPAALTLEAGRAAAGPAASSLPLTHVHAVTVPGAAAAWCDALEEWGTLPLAQVLSPATRLARHGFPVSPLTAASWAECVPQLTAWSAACGAAVQPEALLSSSRPGAAPLAGEVFANPGLADTFDALSAGGKAGFYSGRVAASVVAAVQAAGGLLTLADLEAHSSTFPQPVSVDFFGARVWEVPPNGQGVVALMALQSVAAVLAAAEGPLPAPGPADCQSAAGRLDWVDGFGLLDHLPGVTAAERAALARLREAEGGHNGAAHLHLVVETLRGAFADARAAVADGSGPGGGDGVAIAEALLDPARAARRASKFSAHAPAAEPGGCPDASSETVSFSVVDAAGNAVSFINSNYLGFGSGIVPPGCGFSLQSRGGGFSLQEGHPNALAPRKRPYHTIIPLMLTDRENALLATASCMGAYMQPQGHLQILLNLIAFGADPQTALDAPRLCIADGRAGGAVAFEDGVPDEVVQALQAAGHRVGAHGSAGAAAGFGRALFGRGQMLLRHPRDGCLWGASDGRGDGAAVLCPPPPERVKAQ